MYMYMYMYMYVHEHVIFPCSETLELVCMKNEAGAVYQVVPFYDKLLVTVNSEVHTYVHVYVHVHVDFENVLVFFFRTLMYIGMCAYMYMYT